MIMFLQADFRTALEYMGPHSASLLHISLELAQKPPANAAIPGLEAARRGLVSPIFLHPPPLPPRFYPHNARFGQVLNLLPEVNEEQIGQHHCIVCFVNSKLKNFIHDRELEIQWDFTDANLLYETTLPRSFSQSALGCALWCVRSKGSDLCRHAVFTHTHACL